MHTKLFTKKTLALLSVATLAFSATACGTKSDSQTRTDTRTEVTATPVATEEATAETPEADTTDNNAETTESKDASYQTSAPKKGDLVVTISFKGFGDVKIKMFPDEAPKAVENFTTHAKEGYYDGLTMHRIIDNFMIQGGDPEGTGTGGESIWGTEFENEIVDYLVPIRGSLCMANAGPDTNGSQFFITQTAEKDTSTASGLTDVQTELYETNGGAAWLTGGYTVFGQVYEGMDVVDAIAKVKTDKTTNAPIDPVIISSIKVTKFK